MVQSHQRGRQAQKLHKKSSPKEVRVPVPDLLRLLRLATAEEHARLEQYPLVHVLQSTDLDRTAYARFLRVFHGYYQGLEVRLEPALSVFRAHLPEGYRYASRSNALARDLDALGSELTGSDLPHPRLPEMDTADQLLGILYVVEGSTLGGRMLGPRITQQLALTPGQATRYFDLYEKADWPVLRNWLDTHEPGAGVVAMTEAARATFRTLRHYSNNEVA